MGHVAKRIIGSNNWITWETEADNAIEELYKAADSNDTAAAIAHAGVAIVCEIRALREELRSQDGIQRT